MDAENAAVRQIGRTLTIEYQSGLGNAFESEAIDGALPRRQNTPHEIPNHLYPEAINGTPFTAPRAVNHRTWLYKIRPSLVHSQHERLPDGPFGTDFADAACIPTLMRWKAMPYPGGEGIDFIDGLATLGVSPTSGPGFAIHLYVANASMDARCFYDADGDLLIAPSEGPLTIRTELGVLAAAPGEVALIPRGIKFSVLLGSAHARGFVLETLDSPLRLPERGPIGANGLADERHFLAPIAAFEDREQKGYRVTTKLEGRLWQATQDHSPYDVVAWHGDHVPFKYDLANFNTMGTVSFDHPDPSISTVLTSTACDFAIFPGRWEVAEHTFRPPFFHRNAATEFNAIIKDAAPAPGFEPGGCTLTPMLTAHGITSEGFDREMKRTDDGPRRTSDESLWIQFESRLTLRVTKWALEAAHRDRLYHEAFAGYRSRFVR